MNANTINSMQRMADRTTGSTYKNLDTNRSFLARRNPDNHSSLTTADYNAASLCDTIEQPVSGERFFVTDTQGGEGAGFVVLTTAKITHTFVHQCGRDVPASLSGSYNVPSPNDAGLPANQQVFVFFTPSYCPLEIGDRLTYNGDTYRVKRSDPCNSGCRTELVVVD